MFSATKILSFTFGLLLLATAYSGFAQNKTKPKPKKQDKSTTIGFQTGREVLFNTTPLLHSKQSKVHYGISKSLVLRRPINSHFKVEAGLNYTNIQNAIINPSIGKINTSRPYTFSLPVTIQYYFLPEKCRVHPFCGAGLQCNLLQSKNNLSINTTGDGNQGYYIPQADTKYITILFTQGVTYEVNTKIEITESFHFIPDNTNKIIGIDLGIGFKIP